MELEVQEVKNEIDEYVLAVAPKVGSREHSINIQARLMEAKKKRKDHKVWFDDNVLANIKKVFDEAKEGYNDQKNKIELWLQPLDSWIEDARENILTFERSELAKRVAAQKKEAALKNKRDASAIKAGRPLGAVRPEQPILAPPKTSKSEAGACTIVSRQELVIVDENSIPADYWIKTLNRKMIESALRGGTDVPGARMDEVLGLSGKIA